MVQGVVSAVELEGDAGAAGVWSHLEALETLLENKVDGNFKAIQTLSFAFNC